MALMNNGFGGGGVTVESPDTSNDGGGGSENEDDQEDEQNGGGSSSGPAAGTVRALDHPTAGVQSMTDNTSTESDDSDDDSSSGGDSGGTTSAASGHIRAGLDEDAGSQEIASDKHSGVGTSVDQVVTGEDQDDIVASDSESGNQTVTAVVSEDVTGGDGGTGASVNTQTGEVDSGRPGDTSRVAEAVEAAQSNDSDDSSEDSPDNSDDSGRPRWEAGATATTNTWPGDVVSIGAHVRNQGPAGTAGAGTATVEAAIPSVGISKTKQIELGGGGRRTLNFTLRDATDLEPSTYTAEIRINGQVKDTVRLTRHPENGGNVNGGGGSDGSSGGDSDGQQDSSDSQQSQGSDQSSGRYTTYTSGTGGGGGSTSSSESDGLPVEGIALAAVALLGAYIVYNGGL